jgi:hypothetical protein
VAVVVRLMEQYQAATETRLRWRQTIRQVLAGK